MTSLFHSLLSQLEEKISAKNSVNEKVSLIITSLLHTTITADQIIIQETILRIKAAPTIKMAITLNREKIIKTLNEKGIEVTIIQ